MNLCSVKRSQIEISARSTSENKALLIGEYYFVEQLEPENIPKSLVGLAETAPSGVEPMELAVLPTHLFEEVPVSIGLSLRVA